MKRLLGIVAIIGSMFYGASAHAVGKVYAELGDDYVTAIIYVCRQPYVVEQVYELVPTRGREYVRTVYLTRLIIQGECTVDERLVPQDLLTRCVAYDWRCAQIPVESAFGILFSPIPDEF